MEKTATILNEPRNYIPLTAFALWCLICTFDYDVPFIYNPTPFILIFFCAALYKVKIGWGKLATGLLILAYTFNAFQISNYYETNKYGLRIGVLHLSSSELKLSGLVFCLIYFICYAKQIGGYVRYGIRFMINPEEK